MKGMIYSYHRIPVVKDLVGRKSGCGRGVGGMGDQNLLLLQDHLTSSYHLIVLYNAYPYTSSEFYKLQSSHLIQ